jgi:hypothetical protein
MESKIQNWIQDYCPGVRRVHMESRAKDILVYYEFEGFEDVELLPLALLERRDFDEVMLSRFGKYVPQTLWQLDQQLQRGEADEDATETDD